MSRAEAHIEIDDLQAVLDIPDAVASEGIARPDAESISDEQNRAALAAELAQARQVLDALTGDLRAVDAELESLAMEREQHRLAIDICTSLDRLAGIGGAAVFWGAGGESRAGADHVRAVRMRVDQFSQRLGEIEARRADVIDRIGQQESHAGFMEDVLFEALEEEERRKQEWIVEREISKLPAYKAFMPWSRGGEDDQRFRKNVATALLVCVIFALVVPFIELPQSILKPEVEIPERVVRLLIESRPKPPAPAREMPKPKLEEKLEQQKPKEAPKIQVAKRETEVPEPTVVEPEAKDQGILAFREKLASVQEEQALSRLGSQAQINSAGDAGPAQRAMLTTNAPGSSGGINLASISRSVGGNGGSGGMTRLATTRATSAIGGIGRPGADRPLSGDSVANSRTDEEIQIVFDRYKSALYRLYNRELRKDPTLRGQMVLKLTIEPDGSVSMCQLEASDMNAPELSAQVVERVKTINFGAKDVAALTILYPIDFLPAA
ncbi:outer membrane biosynthesis protein TonB [Povalibacter uvarum]|uniref:Outer membrane biosynthesis protein TonB n=1 Tax=Povalibacter uvarum TaxID=732238 RepID=A0A841HHW2_9GAMM|nr:AgmX/PglI C-terminal domain-containing protein [Povalibacter uvarum]MBB6092376.1 outer membrane biosynthesis protein TonB [Povalibacter uvarum]